MGSVFLDGREFHMERELIDVTMLSRPDPQWRHVDRNGHEHRWFVTQPDGSVQPATTYHPVLQFVVPTVETVVDIEETEEYPPLTHLECRQCRETIEPGYCPDYHQQFIPGFPRYYIDGRSVSFETFKAEAIRAGAPPEAFGLGVPPRVDDGSE